MGADRSIFEDWMHLHLENPALFGGISKHTPSVFAGNFRFCIFFNECSRVDVFPLEHLGDFYLAFRKGLPERTNRTVLRFCVFKKNLKVKIDGPDTNFGRLVNGP